MALCGGPGVHCPRYVPHQIPCTLTQWALQVMSISPGETAPRLPSRYRCHFLCGPAVLTAAVPDLCRSLSGQRRRPPGEQDVAVAAEPSFIPFLLPGAGTRDRDAAPDSG